MVGESEFLEEDDFGTWLTPAEALAELDGIHDFSTRTSAINDRLGAGLIQAAAATFRRKGGTSEGLWRCYVIPGEVWERHAQAAYSNFWQTGQFAFEESRSHAPAIKFSFFGVRFNPGGVIELKKAAGLVERPISRPPMDEREQQKPTPPKKDLARDQAERFSRAILAGWPETTEEVAHQKAKLFFPENNVPRDWFKSIFRVIRGPKNPGKVPKDRA